MPTPMTARPMTRDEQRLRQRRAHEAVDRPTRAFRVSDRAATCAVARVPRPPPRAGGSSSSLALRELKEERAFGDDLSPALSPAAHLVSDRRRASRA